MASRTLFPPVLLARASISQNRARSFAVDGDKVQFIISRYRAFVVLRFARIYRYNARATLHLDSGCFPPVFVSFLPPAASISHADEVSELKSLFPRALKRAFLLR